MDSVRDFLFDMARVKIIGIYLVTSPTGRKYVGQSVDIQKRFWGYLAMTNIDRQVLLGRSFKKHGADKHIFEVIEECDINELNNRERYWQDFYDVLGRNGLNCVLTKSTDKKPFLSDETRRKMSESAKIKIFTETHLDNIRKASAKRIGVKLRPRTQEEKDKMREVIMANRKFGKDNNMHGSARFGEKNPFYNQKHTEESRKKISEKAKGRVPSDEVRKIWSSQRTGGLNSAAKLTINMESGIFYDCGKDAWIAYGGRYTYSTFKSKMNGSNKHPLSYRTV